MSSGVAQSTYVDGLVYICDWGFAIALIAISILLLVAGLIAASLEAMVLTPDFLGVVSYHTRDNPRFSHSKTGTHLDGLERARELHDVSGLIGDIADDEQTSGRIAFVPTHLEGTG